jgi:hypothetical protein
MPGAVRPVLVPLHAWAGHRRRAQRRTCSCSAPAGWPPARSACMASCQKSEIRLSGRGRTARARRILDVMTAVAALCLRRIGRNLTIRRPIPPFAHARGIANPAALDLGGTMTELDQPGGAMKSLLRQRVPLPSSGDRADARHPSRWRESFRVCRWKPVNSVPARSAPAGPSPAVVRPRRFRCATTAGFDLWVATDGSPWRRARVHPTSLAEFPTGGRQSLEESR